MCIKVEHLSKSFTTFERKNTTFQVLRSLVTHQPLRHTLMVLQDLSCEIKKGERLALLGRNGCGKTTFLRILTGIYDASSGTVEVRGIPRALFKSSIGLNAHISVTDNIYLLGAIHGIKRSTVKNKIDEIITLADLANSRFSLLKKLSAGQVQALALSVFFQADGDVMILDEALGSIDHEFIKKCDDYFRNLALSNKTTIMTSHDTSFLKKYCTSALWLDKGGVRMYGDFDKVAAEYEQSFLNHS